MANEIYNSTWFGNSLETAGSIGDKPDLFGSQFDFQYRTRFDNLEAKKCVSDTIFEIGTI